MLLLKQILPLLLLLAAFSAVSSRTIERKTSLAHKHGKVSKHKGKQSTNAPNRYCSCTTKLCKCCGNFNVPVVNVKGPGCASLQYKNGDRLGMLISFGNRVITNTTISGRRPQSICLPLPTGISKFCGRVYNIERDDDDFLACLGLELRSLENIEASLRVSCFRFGPAGLRLEPAQPLPEIPVEVDEDEDDDDDDDDEYDFDDDDDDDEEEDEEEGDDNNNELDSVDYGTFALDDDFVGNLFVESGGNKKKPQKKVQTTARPAVVKKTKKPVATTSKPIVKKTQATTKKTPIVLVSSSTTQTVIKEQVVPQITTTTTSVESVHQDSAQDVAHDPVENSVVTDATQEISTTISIVQGETVKDVIQTTMQDADSVQNATTQESVQNQEDPQTTVQDVVEENTQAVKEAEIMETTATATTLMETTEADTVKPVDIKSKQEEDDYLDIVDDDIDSDEKENEEDDDDDDEDDPIAPITSAVADVFEDDDDDDEDDKKPAKKVTKRA